MIAILHKIFIYLIEHTDYEPPARTEKLPPLKLPNKPSNPDPCMLVKVDAVLELISLACFVKSMRYHSSRDMEAEENYCMIRSCGCDAVRKVKEIDPATWARFDWLE